MKPDPIAKRLHDCADTIYALHAGTHARRLFSKDEIDRLRDMVWRITSMIYEQIKDDTP